MPTDRQTDRHDIVRKHPLRPKSADGYMIRQFVHVSCSHQTVTDFASSVSVFCYSWAVLKPS